MRRSQAGVFGLLSLILFSASTLGSLGSVTAPMAPVAAGSQGLRIAIPGPAGVRATSLSQQWESRNWSGYAISSGTFTSISGSWTVPTVVPPKHLRARQFSSTWVGIDGFILGDDDLIQAGTEQDWLNGKASYQAWWEILPADETIIPSLTIHPGDAMTVTITKGTPDWTIIVSDATTGQSYSPPPQSYHGPLTSAEWIQEAPLVGKRIAPLADDSTVDFEQLTANGTNPDLVTSESGVMAKRGGRLVISSPSTPNPEGNGFAVAYGSEPPPPPS
jgi:hypothetical protein